MTFLGLRHWLRKSLLISSRTIGSKSNKRNKKIEKSLAGQVVMKTTQNLKTINVLALVRSSYRLTHLREILIKTLCRIQPTCSDSLRTKLKLRMSLNKIPNRTVSFSQYFRPLGIKKLIYPTLLRTILLTMKALLTMNSNNLRRVISKGNKCIKHH